MRGYSWLFPESLRSTGQSYSIFATIGDLEWELLEGKGFNPLVGRSFPKQELFFKHVWFLVIKKDIRHGTIYDNMII